MVLIFKKCFILYLYLITNLFFYTHYRKSIEQSYFVNNPFIRYIKIISLKLCDSIYLNIYFEWSKLFILNGILNNIKLMVFSVMIIMHKIKALILNNIFRLYLFIRRFILNHISNTLFCYYTDHIGSLLNTCIY